ncbi:hypothetical protein [Helicobacter pylori]|nr:hypothetical protein [Helicobacter pylori]WJX97716.1 hypothetical protein QU610_07735 [Helicobacter pylori]
MCEFDAVFAFDSYKMNDRKTTKPYDYSKRLGFFSLSKKGF